MRPRITTYVSKVDSAQAGVCWRMRTYADVCGRMLTYALLVPHMFHRWTALGLAVSYGWGGRGGEEKRERLVLDIVALHKSGGAIVDADQLMLFLDNRLAEDFMTEALFSPSIFIFPLCFSGRRPLDALL